MNGLPQCLEYPCTKVSTRHYTSLEYRIFLEKLLSTSFVHGVGMDCEQHYERYCDIFQWMNYEWQKVIIYHYEWHYERHCEQQIESQYFEQQNNSFAHKPDGLLDNNLLIKQKISNILFSDHINLRHWWRWSFVSIWTVVQPSFHSHSKLRKARR